MADFLTVNNTKVPLKISTHARAKRLKLRVDPQGYVSVTKPKMVPTLLAKKFALDNVGWLEQQLKRFAMTHTMPELSDREITEMKIKTRNIVRERLAYFNQFYNYTYHRITIRHQRSRWGSCSSNKTLSFNCRLALVDPELVDYVVVHELCHLKEMNHSPRFWDLVSQTIPNYRTRRAKLKNIHI